MDSPGKPADADPDMDKTREEELLSPYDEEAAEQWYIQEEEWEEVKGTQKEILAVLSETLSDRKRKLSDADDQDNGDAPTANKSKGSENTDDIERDIAKLTQHTGNTSYEVADMEGSDANLATQTLKELEQEYDINEEKGPKLKEPLAKVLNKLSEGKLTDEKVKQKIDKYACPENFSGAKVPKVNSEIWSTLDNNARTVDLRMQKQQRQLTKSMGILAQVCNEIIDTEAASNLLVKLTDAMALINRTNQDISVDRRLRIVNHHTVNNKYKKLASNDVPITDNLFGDDLKGSLSAIENASKLGNTFTQSKAGRKFFPTPNRPKNGEVWRDRGRGRASWSRGRMLTRGRGYPRGRGAWSQRVS